MDIISIMMFEQYTTVRWSISASVLSMSAVIFHYQGVEIECSVPEVPEEFNVSKM